MNHSNLTTKQTVCGMIILVMFGLSCHNFYKPNKSNTSTPETTRSALTAINGNKYFILRRGDSSYTLNNIKVNNITMTLTGTLSKVPVSHLQYIDAFGGRYTYKKKGRPASEIYVLSEVHIFSKSHSPVDVTKAFTLPLDQIEKIEVIEHDAGRTTTSYILGGLGITLGVLVVASAIVALTKSSCPFVSVYDGAQYAVQGELFGGAINRKLERTDFLPLKIKPVNGEFQLRISNELKERQYTNFADLIVIEHNNNTTAGIGADGKVYLLSKPVPPVMALLNDHHDVSNLIRETDWMNCNFADTLATSAINEITLSFQNPGTVKNAKLVLQLKNAYWFDYLYGEFTRNFGSNYAGFQEKQANQPAEKMIQWTRDQHIPLSIAVSTGAGWKEVLKLNTVGPLTNREVVIPVELNSPTNEPIKVKLSTGFMFWELDYAVMHFTEEAPFTTTTLKPYYAMDENGNDVLNQLTGNDDKYVTQLEVGNYATIKYKFDKPLPAGKSYSVVLATKGYYEPIREYSGKPNTAFLKKFREPGAMAAFSKDKYQSIIRNESIIALNSK